MATICPYCRDTINEAEISECPDCGIPHHLACWYENNGCSIPGCTQAPEMEAKPPTSPAQSAQPARAAQSAQPAPTAITPTRTGFKFSCPSCGQHLEAETGWAGMQINCPACSVNLTIPHPGSSTIRSGAVVDLSHPKAASSPAWPTALIVLMYLLGFHILLDVIIFLFGIAAHNGWALFGGITSVGFGVAMLIGLSRKQEWARIMLIWLSYVSLVASLFILAPLEIPILICAHRKSVREATQGASAAKAYTYAPPIPTRKEPEQTNGKVTVQRFQLEGCQCRVKFDPQELQELLYQKILRAIDKKKKQFNLSDGQFLVTGSFKKIDEGNFALHFMLAFLGKASLECEAKVFRNGQILLNEAIQASAACTVFTSPRSQLKYDVQIIADQIIKKTLKADKSLRT
jgi:hypothetical protein